MKQPFYWHHNLLYAEKSREAYTMEEEGTLDHLLYRIYMLAHDCDGLNISDAVKALNTAYYLAVALYNTTHVEECNRMEALTRSKAQEILMEEHKMDKLNVTPADLFLVRWMAWAILKMQKTKPAGLDVFLEKYQQDISWNDDFYYDENGKIARQCSFVYQIPKMVEQMGDVKFDTDLQPNAKNPFFMSDELWIKQIKNLEIVEMEQLLRHYRTIDDQLSLLYYSQNEEELYKEGTIH